METIIGFVMIYAWIHSIVIVSKKISGASTYEVVVMIAGATGFMLYVMGTL